MTLVFPWCVFKLLLSFSVVLHGASPNISCCAIQQISTMVVVNEKYLYFCYLRRLKLSPEPDMRIKDSKYFLKSNYLQIKFVHGQKSKNFHMLHGFSVRLSREYGGH